MTSVRALPGDVALAPGAARTTMRASVLSQAGGSVVSTIRCPEPAAGEVRVRLEGCGVCGSSLPLWEGREWFTYPQEPGVPGHEGWGVIDAIGDGVPADRLGERVALLSGRAFAEFDVAPADHAVPLPAALDGVPFPGEALGCAMNIFARSGVAAGDDVAIVGIGFLGALLTRLATHARARVIAVSRRQEALALARDMGAQEVQPMDDHRRLIDAIRALTGGTGCPVVIECTGHQWPLDLAAEFTRERGRLVIAGYHQDGARQVNMQLWNWRGLDVVNAHERDPKVYVAGMRRAVEAVECGTLEPGRLLTHAYRLDEVDAAFAATRARPTGFIKAWITL